MASVARVTRPPPPPSIVSPSSPVAVIRVWPGATKASSWISARPFRRPARSTKFDNSSCANPMLASDRSRSIGSATGGTPQRAMRALNSCPLAERMKLSMSSRLPSSLSARAGSSRRIVPPPASLRLAPPSPASSASDSSSTVRPAVLNAVWIVTGIGRPAAATCAGGPKRILALPATPGVPAPPSPAESAILASISKRGWMSPPPVSFARTVRSAASSPVDRRKGTPAVMPSTRQGPARVWPSMRTFSAKTWSVRPVVGVTVVTRSCPMRRSSKAQSRRSNSPAARSGGRRQAPSAPVGTRISARPRRVSVKRTSPRKSGARATSARTTAAASEGESGRPVPSRS